VSRWQERFDQWFPDGALVAVCSDVPEESAEDSVVFVCPRVVIDDSSRRPVFHVVCPSVKVSSFGVRSVEVRSEDPPDIVVLSEVDQFYRFVRPWSAQDVEFARRERELLPDLYGLEGDGREG
jgi:hypothetical protein